MEDLAGALGGEHGSVVAEDQDANPVFAAAVVEAETAGMQVLMPYYDHVARASLAPRDPSQDPVTGRLVIALRVAWRRIAGRAEVEEGDAVVHGEGFARCRLRSPSGVTVSAFTSSLVRLPPSPGKRDP